MSSCESVLTYEYDNIDFTEIDAKFAEIERENLTEEQSNN